MRPAHFKDGAVLKTILDFFRNVIILVEEVADYIVSMSWQCS
jgi:hypothetical protein